MKTSPSARRGAAAALAVTAWVWAAALGQAQTTVGDAVLMAYGQMGSGPRPPLIGVRVNDSIDGEIWNLQFQDANFQSQRRLVTIRDGKLSGDAAEAVWPFTQGAYDPIRPEEVGFPVSNLRKIAAERASRTGLKPASLTYVLNHRTGESAASWEIYLVDRKRIIIGHIRLDAASGIVVREEFTVGGVSNTNAPPPQVRRTTTSASKTTSQQRKPARRQEDTGREVSDVFREIGDGFRRIFD